MIPDTSEIADHNLQAALERLAYSAYLLTLDPGVALSVVMTALDGSPEEGTDDPNLLERAVDLSLQQLRRESKIGWDGESSVLDAVFYSNSAAMNSQTLRSLKDLSDNPILLLDSDSRIAFVLHHVLGYKVREAAAMAQVEETEFRAQLRRAYVQLVSSQSAGRLRAGNVFEQSALA
jgi:hypothetical protein